MAEGESGQYHINMEISGAHGNPTFMHVRNGVMSSDITYYFKFGVYVQENKRIEIYHSSD